ncbi:hypothetical protein ABC733_02105 [Mangrovibacter sp. SLW1]
MRKTSQKMLRTLKVDDAGFMSSVAQGVISFPVSMFYLGYNFMDTSNRIANFDDRVRMADLMKRGISVNQEAQKIITIVIQKFMLRVDMEIIQDIAKNLSGLMIGKFIFAELTGINLGAAISSRIMVSFTAGMVTGSLLTIGAETSRAIYTARQLSDQYPALYNQLRSTGDLDLLYFLVEDKVKPFLDACHMADINRNEFNELCRYFFGGL